MYFKRKLFSHLLEWKEKTNRKPLIIRGARQVGKSTLAAQLGATYPHFINLNLEKREHKKIFENIDRTSSILNAIFLQTNTPKDGRPTLLFLDEIQESPRAIQQLRYFYEEFPEIHVMAAGSLLEFAIKNVESFPVGRVEQVVLHPFDFEEYLRAIGQGQAREVLNEIPVPEYAHDKLTEHFKDFLSIGGMPEAISRYVEDGSMANLNEVYDNLWQSYRDDVEKYAKNAKQRNVIRYLMETAVGEQDRISFAHFANSNYTAREVGEAFRVMSLARIIQVVYPTTNLQPPIVPNTKRKPRLLFLDGGLLVHALGFQANMLSLPRMDSFFKGRIAQQFIVQEVAAQFKSPSYKPMFWVREKAGTRSEVDLVMQSGQYIIPIEIKSGKKGKLRSLHQFIERSNHQFGVRFLDNHFSLESAKTPNGQPYRLMNLPLYAACKLPQYLDLFHRTL